jgi:hypothetical protein
LTNTDEQTLLKMKFTEIALLLSLAQLGLAVNIMGVDEMLNIAKNAGKIPSMWFYPSRSIYQG